MRFLMASQSPDVSFLRSLYWRREMRLGMSFLYSSSLANSRLSLSMLMASLAMDKDTTSRSLNRGTTPRRGTFPRSFTKSFEKRLHISRIFTKFAYKLLHIWIIKINILNSNRLHSLLDVCNDSLIFDSYPHFTN